MTPTDEQLAILDARKNTSDNLLISALAGAAKTSTLVLMANDNPTTATLCLAFNKRIAEEMKTRLPSICITQTLNSLGHRVWGQVLNKRLILKADKTYFMVREHIEQQKGNDKAALWDVFQDLLRAVDSGKSSGYVPNDSWPSAKALMDDNDFYNALDEEPSELAWECIRSVSNLSIRAALAGTIDFADQILMPTVFPAVFPSYPLVMVDEAQDLSALNHAMLRKLVRKRIIAVGDECQSIYGFRGAHEDSMSLLRQTFSMRELGLTISFRCPTSVVEEARWRAPHMRWPDDAKAGLVSRLQEWGEKDVPDFSTILCRNNAPLFSMAIRLLKNGRYPELVGNDIGKSLVKTLKKLGPLNMNRDQTLNAIVEWEREKLLKSRSPSSVSDQAECLRVFAEQGSSLDDAVAYAEHLLSRSGPIKLMTIHKAKGLEFETVFFLDEFLISKDKQQEKNLRYVAITRAKNALYYVKSENFQDA